jgi:hypothetical protein
MGEAIVVPRRAGNPGLCAAALRPTPGSSGFTVRSGAGRGRWRRYLDMNLLESKQQIGKAA